jgi:hypothetical protein
MATATKIDPMKAVPLKEFGRSLKPRRCYRTILEWCKFGRINRQTGERYRLESIYLPAGQCTDEDAFRRFIDKVNSNGNGD